MLEAELHDQSACACHSGPFGPGRPPRRRALLRIGALAPLLCAFGASAQAPPAQDTQEGRIADLIEGNHILANENVLDGFGHISVRSVENPGHFFMARSRAPGLVTRDDIMEFNEHSQPVDQRGREMYGERFIHGEVLGARPDVVAVVHSHSPDVLPFGVTRAPFQALIHMAAFLGATPVPVFDIRDVAGDDNRMLVTDSRTGAALAQSLGGRTVVLMRGHGMTVVAPSVKLVVLRSIYTQLNARAEMGALRLGDPIFLNAQEATRTDPVGRPWEAWAARARAGRADTP